MGKLISIGEVLIDMIKLPGKDGQKNAGGAPANVVCAASILGQETMMLSKLGKDENGSFLLDVLNSKGVNTEHIMST